VSLVTQPLEAWGPSSRLYINGHLKTIFTWNTMNISVIQVSFQAKVAKVCLLFVVTKYLCILVPKYLATFNYGASIYGSQTVSFGIPRRLLRKYVIFSKSTEMAELNITIEIVYEAYNNITDNCFLTQQSVAKRRTQCTSYTNKHNMYITYNSVISITRLGIASYLTYTLRRMVKNTFISSMWLKSTLAK